MTATTLENGPEGQLKNWGDIHWRRARKIVRNLRNRIFRARLLRLWKQRPLASSWQMPKAKPARRVYIPKANGKKRPLGIPLRSNRPRRPIRDRVAQAIVKNTLEPEWEAIFEANSYGFRPGRGCHDAIAQCFLRLSRGKNQHGYFDKDKWVLDADIKGFFDNIDHETILNAIRGNTLVKEWLKAGFIEAHRGTEAQRTSTMDERFKPLSINPPCLRASARVESKKGVNPTERGTPQGGVISPLLANIGLHGLETYIKKCNPIA